MTYKYANSFYYSLISNNKGNLPLIMYTTGMKKISNHSLRLVSNKICIIAYKDRYAMKRHFYKITNINYIY